MKLVVVQSLESGVACQDDLLAVFLLKKNDVEIRISVKLFSSLYGYLFLFQQSVMDCGSALGNVVS